LLFVCASTLGAQQLLPRNELFTRADSSKVPPTLFTRNDALLAAGFAGVTVAMFPLDKSLARRLSNEHSKSSRFVDKSATGIELIADPGSLIIGPALYLYGIVTNRSSFEDTGWHGTEAVILASGITGVLKGLAGRARPLVSNDTSPHDFSFARCFRGHDYSSFPSGHSTAAFAAASAVTSETQRTWPGHVWFVAPVMYGGAILVGLARMYHNQYSASDVALGAAIGTFSGLKVVRYTHAHTDNRFDRAILKTSFAPD
jgi:membrane-associated phospholipid phosphatase